MQVVNDSDPRVTPSQNGITYVNSEMILMIAMISWVFRRPNGYRQAIVMMVIIVIIYGSSRQGGLPRGGWRAENG